MFAWNSDNSLKAKETKEKQQHIVWQDPAAYGKLYCFHCLLANFYKTVWKPYIYIYIYCFKCLIYTCMLFNMSYISWGQLFCLNILNHWTIFLNAYLGVFIPQFSIKLKSRQWSMWFNSSHFKLICSASSHIFLTLDNISEHISIDHHQTESANVAQHWMLLGAGIAEGWWAYRLWRPVGRQSRNRVC